MFATHMNTEVEALVDLFLSPSFQPFEEENQDKGCSAAPHKISGTPESEIYDIKPKEKKTLPLRPDQHRIFSAKFESEVVTDDGGFYDAYSRPAGYAIDETFTRKCGHVLAKMGDEFYRTYKLKNEDVSSVPPWESIGEKLKTLFLRIAKKKDTASFTEEEQEQAWKEFKQILSSSVSETLVSDSYKQFGALLLTLRGLSSLGQGAISLARHFFLRFLRERQLDADMRRLGGLDPLVSHELD